MRIPDRIFPLRGTSARETPVFFRLQADFSFCASQRRLRGGASPYRTRSCQKATAPAAATLRESTPCPMGMRTV